MSDLRPHMSGVSGLLIAVGTPFLFVISIFALQLTPVLAADSSITESSITEISIAESSITESPIEAELLPFDENPAYGPGDDESGISAVSEIAPFQEPIEENGTGADTGTFGQRERGGDAPGGSKAQPREQTGKPHKAPKP